MDKVLKELALLGKAVKQVRMQPITKKKVIQELVSNGVAGLIALLTTLLLKQFFVVKSIKNLWGIAAKRDKYQVSQESFEWLNWVLVFLVGLVVFTIVEQVMEKYFEERQKQ